jgi:hypothetical protein
MGITLSRIGWTRNVAHMAKNEKTHTKFKETGHFGEKCIVWGMVQ